MSRSRMPSALRLASQQRQGDPEPAAGHADLVDRLFLAGEGAGKLPKDAADPLSKERGTVLSGLGGGHL